MGALHLAVLLTQTCKMFLTLSIFSKIQPCLDFEHATYGPPDSGESNWVFAKSLLHSAGSGVAMKWPDMAPGILGGRSATPSPGAPPVPVPPSAEAEAGGAPVEPLNGRPR